MNIRQAILKAADHIEQNPAQFNFYKIYVPKCGTPGCALGWIGHFLGCKDQSRADDDGLTNIGYVGSQIGVDPSIFYDQVKALVGDNWRSDNRTCAKGLRLYADKYHQTEQLADLIPASVMRIFTMSSEELARELA